MFGQQLLGPMRMWGSVAAGGNEAVACINTASAIEVAHRDPTERYLSTISLQSGRRFTAGGASSAAQWDPTAHVWSPLDRLTYVDPADSKTYTYRVIKSDHLLNAAVWQTVHTLEKFVAPSALPGGVSP